jgi:hypothetical protein
MTNATGEVRAGQWQAELVTEYCCIPKQEKTPWGDTELKFYNVPMSYIVISKPGTDGVRFGVNRRPNRPLTFTDYREEHSGIAGSTGQWGTRAMNKPGGKRRTMTPTAWKEDVRRLIGEAEADNIVRYLMNGKPLF